MEFEVRNKIETKRCYECIPLTTWRSSEEVGYWKC